MIEKRRPISRRTVLRGMGVMMGLPWLEAMAPRIAFAGDAAAADPVRMACLFFPNGVSTKRWTPEAQGKDYELSPILKPLASVKEDALVLTNLTNRATDTGDGHYVKDAAFLTGTTIHRTTGADLNSGGISIDQLAAKRRGNLTTLPSLELGIEPASTGVDVVVGYTRVYGSYISWSSPTTPLAKEINPKLAFDRLFRSNAAGRRDQTDDDRGVIDLVMDDAKALRGRLGRDDRVKLDEYLDSVRAVERRIDFESGDRKARYRDDPSARAEIEKLGGRVDAYKFDPGRHRERSANHTEHVRLMLDIMVLAFQTDSTRYTSFMFGNAVSNKNFSFLEGVKSGHHEVSHHQNDEEKLKQYELINIWHVEQLVYMLERMKAIREGEKSLLDNSMVLFGSALRDGNSHNPHNLPIVLAGRAGGTLATGRHIAYGKDTPLCNLYVSMLERIGCPVDRFADSTGPLEGLNNPDYKSAAAS
jgi:Protein of unknown function (DUF1552)